ncbi:hypothetical protein C8Q77DRAFT_1149227 [Trametes polyzona]|nr:hypothetical protein C8Q77DRAFT_1149227 [Trametes polyzona]
MRLLSFSTALSLVLLGAPGVFASKCANCRPPISPALGARAVESSSAPSTRVPSFNPTDEAIRTRPLAHNDVSAREPLTNAERIARRLPPQRPAALGRRPLRERTRAARDDDHRAPHPRPSATPCKSSPKRGRLLAFPLGFVSHATNEFGEYVMTSNPEEALVVVLKQCESNSAPFEIQTLNGLRDFSLLGGTVGFGSTSDDLSNGSFNYAYLDGVTSVPHGPARDAPNGFSAATGVGEAIESALWTVTEEPLLTTLHAQWINADGRPAPDVSLVWVTDENAFAFTSDVNAFEKAFGRAQVVSLLFILDIL